ncbi:uncharacterized protein BYT42DRAFT_578319 [Radiomyces spectabilis]|uniref:uncharacterized protein n=1 Tax=Radiomyces spectabilis TaxID=64574 RepID=UPI00221F8880|nr:uncharacterized protein BYT42DRAFT_578319 [Radiomyces spectabilis]KAI8372883.1 hypothetical protein BYT42DRAFT_578319 [Radiomyces spectabilis]
MSIEESAGDRLSCEMLPKEIILHIFSFFSTSDLRHLLETEWSAICKPILLQRIKYEKWELQILEPHQYAALSYNPGFRPPLFMRLMCADYNVKSEYLIFVPTTVDPSPCVSLPSHAHLWCDQWPQLSALKYSSDRPLDLSQRRESLPEDIQVTSNYCLQTMASDSEDLPHQHIRSVSVSLDWIIQGFAG